MKLRNLIRYLLLALFMLGCGIFSKYTVVFKDPNYTYSVLPKPKENRYVTHFNAVDINVESPKSMTITERCALTIYNESQSDAAIINAYYDKFTKVKSLKGVVKDKDGKFVKNINSENLIDISTQDGSALYQDSRVKAASLQHTSYPYTIEYEIVTESSSLLNLPRYFPNSSLDTVLYGRLTVHFPDSNPVRYKLYNTDVEPVVTKIEQITTLDWEFKNLKNFTFVTNYKPYKDQIMRIDLATTFLDVENYSGRIDSWKEFGLWYNKLLVGKTNVPDELKKLIDETLVGKETKEEKVKAIYELMQNQTRYISVQLGIGGWQPFDAAYVFKNKYGDCKALSNYMYSMLTYAGIESYHALATRGDGRSGVDPDFSSNGFNHQILVVPNGENYIWLECTEQTIPFNHIGSDNQDRYVLVIKPNGGELVATPSAKSLKSTTYTQTNFTFNSLGDVNIAHTETHTGNNQDFYRRYLYKRSKTVIEKYVHSAFPLNNVLINNVNFDEVGNRKDSLTIQFDLVARSYGSRSGSRLFIPLNTLNKWARTLPDSKERDKDVWLYEPIYDVSKTIFEIPSEFKVEFLPKNIKYETEFGVYELQLNQVDETHIEVTRNIAIHETIIKAEKYNELKEFMKTSKTGDAQKIILSLK